LIVIAARDGMLPYFLIFRLSVDDQRVDVCAKKPAPEHEAHLYGMVGIVVTKCATTAHNMSPLKTR
jgi:hypothetical protein